MRAALLALLFLFIAISAVAQPYLRGVNISEAEWGDPYNPGCGEGSCYGYASQPTYNYFAARSLPLIRLQVKWERLQPVLNGPLDATQVAYLQQEVAYAKAAGAGIVICPHNEARYATLESMFANFDSEACIIDNPCPGSTDVTSADFANFWVQMSNLFINEPTVLAYDLTNEPHDMGVANWATIAQTVINAIRNNGDNKTIMIEGNSWANAYLWPSVNGGTGFITDPQNNYFYEAHLYFDSDFSGTYAENYDEELAANPDLPQVGVTRVQPFINWCATNNVPCYLGEYGIPNDDPRWLTVLDNFLTAIDAAQMPGTYWAAGEMWGSYPLSVQPSNNFTTDAEQLPTLVGHLPPGAFRTASAAASFGYNSAPGQLVAGYAGVGGQLATSTEFAAELPLPQTLGGAQIQLTDSGGNVYYAGMLYASATQINYQIPSAAAAGAGDVKVLVGASVVAEGVVNIAPLAPTIFTANSNGSGVPAAQIQRVHPDGTYDYEDVFTYDAASGQFVPAPIVFNDDDLYLLLYGTGFDTASGASGTHVLVGNVTALDVQYSGAQGQYAGLDQIVAQLPSFLAGKGQMNVSVAVDGQPANQVAIAFQ